MRDSFSYVTRDPFGVPARDSGKAWACAHPPPATVLGPSSPNVIQHTKCLLLLYAVDNFGRGCGTRTHGLLLPPRTKHDNFYMSAWSGYRDSNSGPPAPKAGALPTALYPAHADTYDMFVTGQELGARTLSRRTAGSCANPRSCMVRPEGVEPPTLWSEAKCSIH